MSELCIVAKQGPAEARELIQLLLQHGNVLLSSC